MGLDMYLYKEMMVHKPSEIYSEFGHQRYHTKRHKKIIENIPEFKDTNISIKGIAIQWRKSNQIHKWFVKYVQLGKDECQTEYVSHEQLEELLKTISEVLKDHSKAEELLPTQEGFFFGGTKYDECYFKDLEFTKKKLKKLIEDPQFKYYEFSYHASW